MPKDEEAERLRKEKEAEEEKNEVTRKQLLTSRKLGKCELLLIVHCSQVLVDLSDDEGGEEGGASKTKKEEPEDLGIPNVAVGWKTIIF